MLKVFMYVIFFFENVMNFLSVFIVNIDLILKFGKYWVVIVMYSFL